jgi:rubrerythrin
MTLMFGIEEILQMAQRIERNGAAFYRAAAEGIDRPVLQAKLEELAAMEDAHREVFIAMAEELAPRDESSDAAPISDETSAYLRTMADATVFEEDLDPVALATKLASSQELLRTAIHLEKETILFYLGLRELVVGTGPQERMERILQEEMGHVALLKQQLTALE